MRILFIGLILAVAALGISIASDSTPESNYVKNLRGTINFYIVQYESNELMIKYLQEYNDNSKQMVNSLSKLLSIYDKNHTGINWDNLEILKGDTLPINMVDENFDVEDFQSQPPVDPLPAGK